MPTVGALLITVADAVPVAVPPSPSSAVAVQPMTSSTTCAVVISYVAPALPSDQVMATVGVSAASASVADALQVRVSPTCTVLADRVGPLSTGAVLSTVRSASPVGPSPVPSLGVTTTR